MKLSDLDLDQVRACVDLEGFRNRLKQTGLSDDNQHNLLIPLVTHRWADADAIASLVTVRAIIQLLAEQSGLAVEVPLVTPGGVPHPQNKAMLMVSKTSVSESLPENPDAIILVDAADLTLQNVGLDDVDVTIAIDPGHDTEPDAGILLIDGDGRATCTITTLMYLALRAEHDQVDSVLDIEPDPMLATLVHFGVVQDTNDCSAASGATELDDWVRRWGYIHQDMNAYRRIKLFPTPRAFRIIKQHALNHTWESQGSLIASCLGYIREDHVDLVSVVADELRREEKVRKAVALGIIDEEDRAPQIKVCLRTDLDTTDTVADIQNLIGPRAGGAQGVVAGIADLGYRGDLIRLASSDPEDAGLETEILPALFLRLLQGWKDDDNIPDALQPLDELLRINRRELDCDEEQEGEIVLQWFCHHRSQWSQDRKKRAAEHGDDDTFLSQEEELAELFREAREERSGKPTTGTPRAVMESLIFHQIVRRARSIFDEET